MDNSVPRALRTPHKVPILIFTIGVEFACYKLANNTLESFEALPKHIDGNCNLNNCDLTTLKDIDKHVFSINGDLHMVANQIASGYLDLFGIDKLQKIKCSNKEIEEIVNKWLPSKDLINFQDEMIKSGFESYL